MEPPIIPPQEEIQENPLQEPQIQEPQKKDFTDLFKNPFIALALIIVLVLVGIVSWYFWQVFSEGLLKSSMPVTEEKQDILKSLSENNPVPSMSFKERKQILDNLNSSVSSK